MSKTRNTHDALRTSHTAGSDEISKIALERHDWPTIEKIPDDSFKQLLQTEINKKVTRNVSLKDCTIEQRFRGGFNHIVLLSVAIDKRFKDGLRDPGAGHWCQEPLAGGRCTQHAMQSSFDDVFASGDRCTRAQGCCVPNSTIGALYILMKRMRGRPAQNVW